MQLEGEEVDLFLEFLLQGMMDVYYYNNGDQAYYFFEKEDGSVQMITKRPEKIINGKYVKDKQYDGQLRFLFYGHLPPLYQKHFIDFERKAIINIAKTYHDDVCQTGEACIVYVDEKPNALFLEWDFSVYAGIAPVQYTNKLVENYDVKDVEMSGYFPQIGAQVNVFYPGLSKSFSLLLDVSLSKFNINRKKVSPIRDVESKAYILSPRIGIKYRYPKYKLCPFCEAGGVYTKLLNSKIHYYLNMDKSYRSEPEYGMKSYYMGFYGAAGIDYKLKRNNALFLSFSYDFVQKVDMTQDQGVDPLSMAHIKLGYTF